MAYRVAATHNGRFHPDDVFSGALLRRIFPEIEIIRTRDEAVIRQADIVFDVGGLYDPGLKRFDHHQLNAPERGDGSLYSAFGLLWREYGEKYCGSMGVAKSIENTLVRLIDADDNGVQAEAGGTHNLKVVDLINNLNPLFGSDEDFDTQYHKAVDLAEKILGRFVESEKSICETRRYVKESYENSVDSQYIVLDRFGDYDKIIAEIDEALYFISPSEDGRFWRLEAVREKLDDFAVRRPLPEAWAGLEGEQLARVTDVSDAVFCHKNRYLIITETKQGAITILDSLIRKGDVDV